MEVLQFFEYPSVAGICLAIVFGLIWLAALGVWQFRGKWLWLVMAGIVVFPVSIGLVQSPLQTLIGNSFLNRFGMQTYIDWLFLMGIPTILVSGLVQEGFKMLPTVLWWWGQNRQLSPKTGLAIGAMVGAGFGVCEAQWLLNQVFAAGFTWDWVAQYGFEAILPFWERFFTVGFNIALGALSGYGLAKGKGWQFYLIAAGIHALTNYTILFFAKEMITAVQIEIIIAVISVIVFGIVLWLRWRKEPEKPVTGTPAPVGMPPATPSSSGTSL
jgi:RsiW-degrading membrane proteinase PrsW (M82 family)